MGVHFIFLCFYANSATGRVVGWSSPTFWSRHISHRARSENINSIGPVTLLSFFFFFLKVIILFNIKMLVDSRLGTVPG